jgi:hypothetical protein
MSAATPGTPTRTTLGDLKRAVIDTLGPASYDTGGSLIDLSATFPSKVLGVTVIAVSPHASDKYYVTFIPGASDGPALGKLKIRDLSAASDAEVSSTTDLSATTFRIEAIGL